MSLDRGRVPVNRNMVTLARESRGLTQKDLAEKLGVTQGRLSKIEMGFLDVDEALLAALSESLHYPTTFFCQEGPAYGVSVTEVFHRKKADAARKRLNQIYAEIEIRMRHVVALTKSVQVEYRVPHLDIDEYGGKAAEIARTTRAMLGVPPGPIGNLVSTLERAGVLIVPMDFGTDRIDAITKVTTTLPPVFFVNRNSGVPTDRFRMTLAHELGHAVMHTLPDPDMEDQAWDFAAEFLMPEREIYADLRDLDPARLPQLKRYWKVSMAALAQHAERIRAINYNQKRYLFMKLSAAGYRRREPPELDLPYERPTLLLEVIEQHLSDLGYTRGSLADMLNLERHEFDHEYIEPFHEPRSGLTLVK